MLPPSPYVPPCCFTVYACVCAFCYDDEFDDGTHAQNASIRSHTCLVESQLQSVFYHVCNVAEMAFCNWLAVINRMV